MQRAAEMAALSAAAAAAAARYDRTLGVDFTNVFRARFLQNVTRKKTFI